MNAIRNKVQIIGHLGRNPEIKIIGEGKKLAAINVAINETYTNARGEKITDTQWHHVVAWGKLAEMAGKHLVKGTEIAVEGRLVNRNYTDKQGVKRYSTQIQASEILILDKYRNDRPA